MSAYIRYQPIALGGGGGGSTGVTSLNGETGAITLVAGSNITITPSGQDITISSTGGGGSGVVTANLYDNIDTSVTSGPAIVSPFVVDGITVVNGDTVLFANLATGNNEVYQASITGSSISWTALPVFNGEAAPFAGALIVITQGFIYANQLGEYTGTVWQFNGVTQVFTTVSIVDDTSDGTVFSIPYANAQNIIVDYSVIRNGTKEAGIITLTTDGSTVGIAVDGSATAATGVSFSAVISGSNIILQYTSTSTGFSGNMTYAYTAWSDEPGGPGALNSAVLVDDTTDGTIFTRNFANAENLLVYYSLMRDGVKEAGILTITTDGTNVGIAADGSSTGTTGIIFSGIVSGSAIVLQYTTTSTGFNASMTYIIKSWSDSAGTMTSFIGGTVATTPPAGSDTNIQFNQAGSFGASSNLSYDYTDNLLLLGGKQVSILNETTFLDNQSSPALLFSMPAIYNSVFLEYTAIRGTNVRTGTILIATDGSVGISEAEDYAESGTTGLTFTVTLSGGNINVNYTSTSTGSGGTYKYAFSRW